MRLDPVRDPGDDGPEPDHRSPVTRPFGGAGFRTSSADQRRFRSVADRLHRATAASLVLDEAVVRACSVSRSARSAGPAAATSTRAVR